MAKIIAVCKSAEKGTRKEAVVEGVLKEGYGLVGDVHADCCTHRQVSLLALESIYKMRRLGLNVGPGDFAENLTTQGLDLPPYPRAQKYPLARTLYLRSPRLVRNVIAVVLSISR